MFVPFKNVRSHPCNTSFLLDHPWWVLSLVIIFYRRTGRDVLAGKKIQVLSNGRVNFSDFFSDSGMFVLFYKLMLSLLLIFFLSFFLLKNCNDTITMKRQNWEVKKIKLSFIHWNWLKWGLSTMITRFKLLIAVV